MTPNQIKTVQDSFDRVFPVKEAMSESFYAELFIIAPGVIPPARRCDSFGIPNLVKV